MNDITFIIKTFQRHHLLERLLKSIREFYPDVEILVCDDSGYLRDEILQLSHDYNVKIFYTPFDIGLSAGRNLLVSQVQTKYFLLLDDDFVFTSNTKVELLQEHLEKDDLDIVGGSLYQNGAIHHYEGIYVKPDDAPDTLKLVSIPGQYNFVLNFFLAKTESILKYRWDNKLKLAEHTAFFWRHRENLAIGYQPACIVEHRQENIGDYMKYRKRAYRYYDLFLEEEGIKEVIDLKGKSYKPGDWKSWDKNISL